jgi:hypothetical protein
MVAAVDSRRLTIDRRDCAHPYQPYSCAAAQRHRANWHEYPGLDSAGRLTPEWSRRAGSPVILALTARGSLGSLGARRIQSAVLIPNADKATIDPAKLRDYLLSATHPIGRFKARFFNALGFSPDRWEELGAALRLQHLTRDGEPAGPTAQGRKYTIRAILNGPAGQSALGVSVWFIPADGNVPRVVTAYPGE